jgi:hypothetical protein
MIHKLQIFWNAERETEFIIEKIKRKMHNPEL